MTDDERARFREVAERDPPKRRVRELWVIAGRRSGKDSVAAAIATVAAMGEYRAHLRPGERASIMCLASDRGQSKIVHRYILGNFTTVPLLSPLIERSTEETIELSNRVEVIVSTNSYRAVRGRSIVCAIFDEVAFWRDEASATPDIETYNAIEPSLVTLPGSMLIGISSPYRRSGLLFERWQRFYGTDDDDILVVRGPSKLFNPTLPQSIIDRALERDPEAAAAEWLAEWRSDIADFVSREVVDAVVAHGVFERSPGPGVTYCGFVDPSGGSSDAMTLGIAHLDRDGIAILDAIREVRPPFSPESVVTDFSTLLKGYGITTVYGDRYAGEWPRERFALQGIRYATADKPKNDLYRDALPLLNSAKVQLLDHTRLAAQLCALERRTSRGGRDSIDHPPGGHDDVANAAMGALLHAKVKPPQPARMVRLNIMAR
ncbi:hypothetical protein L2A60_13830 [Acidiphilium iwatense]|uniref:Terminase n=2 Tax=Acidiphilium iwatense TaxID=768198 RepID=A0ABS9E2D7_9PROT|nr:hypothetical protein [Acidiphilium iwatense]